MLPAVLILNEALSMSLLMIACLSLGLFSSNHWALTQTLAGPEAAGKWTGIQNCLGNFAGVSRLADWFYTCLELTRSLPRSQLPATSSRGNDRVLVRDRAHGAAFDWSTEVTIEPASSF